MLLLHTVLAVVCGRMLVSAHPEPVRGRDWYSGDTEFTDTNVPSYHVQHSAPADSDEPWGWAPQGPQQVLDTPPHHAEGSAFLGVDPKTWPKPPHPVPGPPQDRPEPPQFAPEPHYPPPPPGPPGPPGPPSPLPPPSKDGLPHLPHSPHFPKPGDNTKAQTVYQFLEGHPKFSRLFKLVNYTEDITNLLNDSAQSVTFFALPDFGFPKPPHRRGSSDEDFEFEDLLQIREGSVGDMLATAEGYLNSVRRPDEKKIKAFLKYVLLYNILPENTPLQELGKNNTFATALKLPDGSLDGEPLRIHVKKSFFLDPRPSVNFFSKVLIPDIPVKNGVIHVINKPILPPPSIFQIGFLLQNVFSTFTSALQRVGLTDELDFRNLGRGSVQGEPAVSVFAPTNKAFAKLPPKLKLFLFSPFGEKALKKLLQFHIVPKAVVHSNYFHNASSSESASPRDSSETSEFFSNIGHHLEEWSAILEERFDDEDSYENNAWREENLNLGGLSWKNDYQYGYGSRPSGEPFPHEGPHEGPHFPNPGDGPQHHGPFSSPPPPAQGDSHPPPHFPPPPEVWVHYPPPPPPSPPPHYTQNRPDRTPPPPPEVWVHYPPPPPPPHGPHHPPHFHAPPPPPPPFDDWPNHTPPPPRGPPHAPHFPPPPPPPHGPHHAPYFPPPPPFESWPHHAPPPPSRPPGGPHSPSHPRGKVPKGSPRHKVIFSVNTTVPTLLENFALHLKVVQVAFEGPLPKKPFLAGYHTIVIAHGQPVAVADVAARNGAIHVITKLLNPFKKPGDHQKQDKEGEEPAFGSFIEESEDEWAGWEEWLPRWAGED